jgi:hypothetical protein
MIRMIIFIIHSPDYAPAAVLGGRFGAGDGAGA